MTSVTRYRLTAELNRQHKLAQDIARGQSDISTTKRIQAPSDDPAAAHRVAQIRQAQSNQATWAANIDAASALAAQLDTSLTSVSSAVDRAHELMLSAANGTLSPENRATIAAELRGIAEDVGALSTQQDSRGQPLYASGTPLAVPIGQSVTVAPQSSRDGVFDNIATAAGPRSLVQILTNAADAITTGDATARAAATTTSTTALGAAADSITEAHGEQGVRAARLDTAKQRLIDIGLVQTDERTALEATDVTDTVARLQAQMLALEAAQAAFARTSKQTLFDLLG